MSELLIEVTRGNIVECMHRGDIVVSDSSGNLIATAGDSEKVSYLRSAAKPLQALNIFTSGAYDHYHLSDREVAVVCSSHYAEEFHLKSVNAILEKIGLNKEHILGGTVTSLNPRYALELAWKNIELSPLFSDCSGKHAGMLAVCQHLVCDLRNYLQPNHPCQLGILKALSEMCSVPEGEIQLGIDGCSAPVHAMKLHNIAIGFARLANSTNAPALYQAGSEIIFNAMTLHPEMVAGTGGFCTDLIANTNKRLVGKIGAEGVYCIGVKNKDIGIAIKVESGSMAVLPPIAIRVLEQLDLLDNNELHDLKKYRIMENKNDLGAVVGIIEPVFDLKFHHA